jgi:pSer/pThr/pTyr-binding forkhead associated (FHA) protein
MSRRLRTPVELQALIAVEREGEPFLVYSAQDGAQMLLSLANRERRITIGRALECDVPLFYDAGVSRTHALLECLGSDWTLVDDGLSRNGSFINGTRITGRRRLADGDRLVFGDSLVVFRAPVRIDRDPTVALPDAESAATLSATQRAVLVALARPVWSGDAAAPATNLAVAQEINLSVDSVKAHLRVLYERYAIAGLPQNEKRARLVEIVLSTGVVTPRDF